MAREHRFYRNPRPTRARLGRVRDPDRDNHEPLFLAFAVIWPLVLLWILIAYFFRHKIQLLGGRLHAYLQPIRAHAATFLNRTTAQLRHSPTFANVGNRLQPIFHKLPRLPWFLALSHAFYGLWLPIRFPTYAGVPLWLVLTGLFRSYKWVATVKIWLRFYLWLDVFVCAYFSVARYFLGVCAVLLIVVPALKTRWRFWKQERRWIKLAHHALELVAGYCSLAWMLGYPPGDVGQMGVDTLAWLLWRDFFGDIARTRRYMLRYPTSLWWPDNSRGFRLPTVLWTDSSYIRNPALIRQLCSKLSSLHAQPFLIAFGELLFLRHAGRQNKDAKYYPLRWDAQERITLADIVELGHYVVLYQLAATEKWIAGGEDTAAGYLVQALKGLEIVGPALLPLVYVWWQTYEILVFELGGWLWEKQEKQGECISSPEQFFTPRWRGGEGGRSGTTFPGETKTTHEPKTKRQALPPEPETPTPRERLARPKHEATGAERMPKDTSEPPPSQPRPQGEITGQGKEDPVTPIQPRKELKPPRTTKVRTKRNLSSEEVALCGHYAGRFREWRLYLTDPRRVRFPSVFTQTLDVPTSFSESEGYGEVKVGGSMLAPPVQYTLNPDTQHATFLNTRRSSKEDQNKVAKHLQKKGWDATVDIAPAPNESLGDHAFCQEDWDTLRRRPRLRWDLEAALIKGEKKHLAPEEAESGPEASDEDRNEENGEPKVSEDKEIEKPKPKPKSKEGTKHSDDPPIGSRPMPSSRPGGGKGGSKAKSTEKIQAPNLDYDLEIRLLQDKLRLDEDSGVIYVTDESDTETGSPPGSSEKRRLLEEASARRRRPERSSEQRELACMWRETRRESDMRALEKTLKKEEEMAALGLKRDGEMWVKIQDESDEEYAEGEEVVTLVVVVAMTMLVLVAIAWWAGVFDLIWGMGRARAARREDSGDIDSDLEEYFERWRTKTAYTAYE